MLRAEAVTEALCNWDYSAGRLEAQEHAPIKSFSVANACPKGRGNIRGNALGWILFFKEGSYRKCSPSFPRHFHSS